MAKLAKSRKVARKKSKNRKINRVKKKNTSSPPLKTTISKKWRTKKSRTSVKPFYGRVDTLINKLIKAKRIRDKLEQLGLQETK
jgi:TATA-binding protein-associated factor Taf7